MSSRRAGSITLPLVIGVLLCGGTLIGRSALLERRLRVLLERETSAREELAGREAELARLNARLLEDSRRDPLTGLRNRRALVEDLPDVELDARRHGQSFAIAICDVDRFKAYSRRAADRPPPQRRRRARPDGGRRAHRAGDRAGARDRRRGDDRRGEAMIAGRPYRPGMAPEEARAELERCSGTQFDPTVVEAFLGTLAAPRVRPRLGAPAV